MEQINADEIGMKVKEWFLTKVILFKLWMDDSEHKVYALMSLAAVFVVIITRMQFNG